jgi:uncharacterized protein (TIGR00730 family)
VTTIAIYGSSSVQPDEPDYIAAYEVGRALGAAKYGVMTGGYCGVMEAASRGAAEAGSHVIGVTSQPIEAFRRQGPNQWVGKIVPYNTLRDRLIHLVTRADGYVIMPGGIGTLNEMLMTWELMRVREIPPRPIVCYGNYWETILAPFRQSAYVPAVYWELMSFAHTPEEVVTIFDQNDF